MSKILFRRDRKRLARGVIDELSLEDNGIYPDINKIKENISR